MVQRGERRPPRLARSSNTVESVALATRAFAAGQRRALSGVDRGDSASTHWQLLQQPVQHTRVSERLGSYLGDVEIALDEFYRGVVLVWWRETVSEGVVGEQARVVWVAFVKTLQKHDVFSILGPKTCKTCLFKIEFM